MSATRRRLLASCECGAPLELALAPGVTPPNEILCARCGRSRTLDPDGGDAAGGLWRCLACGHPELYSRKDFPRAAGVGIVAAAAVLAPFTSYASLAAAAALDGALYLLVPDVVACYVCGAEHRGFARAPRHPRFDREIDERLRYGRKAVMGKPMREGGTAGAPDPEH